MARITSFDDTVVMKTVTEAICRAVVKALDEVAKELRSELHTDTATIRIEQSPYKDRPRIVVSIDVSPRFM